jgi:hypothetical protein
VLRDLLLLEEVLLVGSVVEPLLLQDVLVPALRGTERLCLLADRLALLGAVLLAAHRTDFGGLLVGAVAVPVLAGAVRRGNVVVVVVHQFSRFEVQRVYHRLWYYTNS